MTTHYIDPHEFRDIKRYELLDRIEQGWTLRRKAWANTSFERKGSEAFHERDGLLYRDWEGRPPVPTLVKRNHKYFLNDAITYVKQTPNSYLREETWMEGKFIKWDFVNKRLVHVFEYPLVNEDALVSFSGDMFDKDRYEIWLEDKK